MRHSSYLEVNLGLMAQNFQEIQKLAPKAEILPMLKANAYGNGLPAIARHLETEFDISKIGLATIGEAQVLLEAYSKFKSEILIFSDTEIQHPDVWDIYSSFNFTPVIFQESDLSVFLKEVSFKKKPLVLKVNTGMNRLGFTMEDLERNLPALRNRGVKHLVTHFARADEKLRPGDKTHKQFDEFKRMQKFLTDAGVSVEETSVSNSGAIEQKYGVEETYVRPGLMLYGPPSVKPHIWHGHQISKFVTKVITTFKVKKGVPMGYGSNVADRDGFVAVVAVGYADGLIALDSGTKIMVKGYQAKIFGRVNMDMAFLFFDPEVEGKIKNEEAIEIWNHDNKVIADIATQNKTITYKLMCGISSRIPRIYKVK